MTNWLLGVVLGVLAIVLGGIALVYPLPASIGVTFFVAWSFIVLGVVAVISAFTGNQTNGRIWSVLLGILMVITGIVLLKNPLAAVLALSMVVAIMTLASGIVKFFTGWKIRDNGLKWLTILSGVASIILAILIFQLPGVSLGILVASELIFDGVALITLSLARKSGGVEAT